MSFCFALRLAKANAAYAIKLAEKNAKFASRNAAAAAKAAREADRVRDERLFSRDALMRQFDARGEVLRFFTTHISEGNTWNDTTRLEAIKIANLVGRGFGDPSFANSVLNALLVHAASWRMLPFEGRPYHQSELYEAHKLFDAEMWRVIELTARRAGAEAAVDRPQVPDETLWSDRARSTATADGTR